MGFAPTGKRRLCTAHTRNGHLALTAKRLETARRLLQLADEIEQRAREVDRRVRPPKEPARGPDNPQMFRCVQLFFVCDAS